MESYRTEKPPGRKRFNRAARSFFRCLAAVFSCCLLHSVQAQQSVNLAWDPSPSPGVVGYTVRYGTNSSSYSDFILVGLETAAEIPDLEEGATYYFVVTAFTVTGVESDPSNRIAITIPAGTAGNPPTLNAIANMTVDEDDAQQTVSLSGISAGLGNVLQLLGIGVTTSSSNPSLVPNPTVSYSSPATTGTLRFTPAANASGTAIITVTVNNFLLLNNLFSQRFTVTVNSINDAPTLDSIPDLNLSVGAGDQTISLSGIGTGASNESQPLTVTATSSNPALIPAPVVTYSSPGSIGSLVLSPVVGATGSATITVRVNDGQSQNNIATRTFVVNVNAATASANFTYYLEAEAGALTTPMIVASSASASNGRYVYSRSSDQGTVTFQLNTPQAGNYVIWCRVLSVDNSTDSFYISVDGGPEEIYRTAQNIWSPNWQWTRINDGPTTIPLIFTLSQAQHTFRFRAREPSTLLDAVYISSDVNFVPVKLDVSRVTTPARGVQLSFQSVAGYKYALEATEDLRSWSNIWSIPTNTTASQPFSVTDTAQTASGRRFYRVRVNQ